MRSMRATFSELSGVVPGLGRFQAGLVRVLGDVATKKVELLDGSNEMVEAILLPEAAFALELAVDGGRHESLPGLALSQQRLLGRKRREEMHVVRHDHVVRQVVLRPIGMTQTVGNDF